MNVNKLLDSDHARDERESFFTRQLERLAAEDRPVVGVFCSACGITHGPYCPVAVAAIQVSEEVRPTHRATIVIDFIADPDGSNDLAQSMANRLAVEFGHVGARVHAEVRKL